MRWKSRYWVYLMLFALAAINYLDRVALSVSAGRIQTALDIDKVQLGYLFSSFLWGYTLCLIPIGLLVDRFGSRTVTAASMALWSAATALTGAAVSMGGIIAARVVMGIGESSCYPAASRIIREWVPSGERGTAMTLFNSGAYFGPALGAVGLSWLVSVLDWRWSFVICGVIGFVWLGLWLAFFRQPEHTTWLSTEERDTIRRERETSSQSEAAAANPVGLGRLIASRTMWGLMLTQGAGAYTQYLFLTWLPNYLQAERGMTLLKSGTVMALPYLGSIVVSVALGMFSDRLLTARAVEAGRRRLVLGAVVLGGAVILFVPWVTSIEAILLLITVALGSVATGNALNITLLGDLLRSKADLGRATGLLLIGGNVFGFLAPIVTGYVVQATGRFDTAFAAAGGLLVMGALSSWFLTRSPIGERAGVTLRGDMTEQIEG
ncbi:MFS transporter [Paraburkholderia caballeronis]|uniref:MFS transporter n=1 Tax=Paraburkholderia caballeronis TaxID=416943 RepID=UPI0010D16477|nr:MFS transporter [Paraburkholderia caballeronis]TDV02356.1 ACS family glucarate transporter-like MFS transporter [Paraburkholderia caballeronis]TDV16733.1 ACS family glucarate transporter-like MFS transporter [Paraburkholderia caballeronis]TDV18772.1 ACS family glucarate transporter-like MFS transporter [Paraburkholderia caballeronis]